MTNVPIYRALVVDDVMLVRRATIRALEQEGFECHSASDGREALERIRRERFDAVVTDLRMPEMNGHQLTVELLEEPQPFVIVVLTGVDEPRLVRDLIQRGVDEVLMKPIEYSVLAARVAALVQRRHEVAPETQPKTVSRFDAKIVRQPATAEAPPSAEVVAAKIAEVRERLPAPPADFDAFQAATDRVLTSCDLKQAVAAQAEVGSEVINLANSVVFATTQKISSLEGVISELRQSLSFGRIAAMTLGPFVAGIVLGWLLAILTPS